MGEWINDSITTMMWWMVKLWGKRNEELHEKKEKQQRAAGRTLEQRVRRTFDRIRGNYYQKIGS